MDNAQLISQLAQKYRDGTATEEEREQLEQWLNLLQLDQTMLADENRIQQRAEKVWSKLDGQWHTPEIPVQRVRILKTVWIRYAAAVIIIAGIGAYLWTTSDKQQNPQTAQINPVPVKNDIAPGGNKATLTLADGSKIVLDSAANGKIAQQDNTTITKNGDQILYSSPVSRLPSAGSPLTYNTMTTPRGGQYQLSLPDGSKVWLNAASSITYPTAFTEKERKVSITGEAYFEVTKDKTKPFIVAVNTSTVSRLPSSDKKHGLEIEVLGTQFNINAYEDEAAIKTSLLEGSVKIEDKILKPGQAYINGKIVTTNTEQDVAWKNGIFNFKDMNMEQAMRQLARWYDVEIIYDNGVPEKELFGEIDRNITLIDVLAGLQGIVATYRLEGKKVHVTPLKK